MSQRADMNHVVYSGWMIKSPPEKKLTGPWKIFRAKWKRRYFVLSKPAQSLPGAYILNYFSDENCKRLKGHIDLDQCLEIIESLDSDQFQFLLAIKTTHKGKERTYFLATETEDQMTTWVRNLCTVCGMKPEESEPEPPRPPLREDPVRTSPPRAHGPKPNQPSVNHSVKPSPSQRHNTPPPQRHETTPVPSIRRPPPPVTTQPQTNDANRGSEYIPLETCTSGASVKRTPRQISIDSVPDEIAPPPPIKGDGNDSDNDVFGRHQTYDIPPSAILEEDSIYKVPPPRPTQNGHGAPVALDIYDIPPERNSPSSPHSSSSESQKGDSHLGQGLVYDFPPPGRNEIMKDDVYDIPPSHCDSVDISKISLDDVPPARPPKPSHLIPQSAQEPYMNLPNNSKVFTDINKNVPLDIRSAPPPAVCAGMIHADNYDIPLSDSAKSVILADAKEKILDSTPPPPMQCGSEHKYINAAPGFVPEQDVYLPMDPVVPGPRKSSSTDNEVEYTDMSGKSSLNNSFESRPVYDHPPARPAPAPRPDGPPQRPRKPATTALDATDTYHIFHTQRTRSFKKSTSSAGSPMLTRRAPPPKPVMTSVPLPVSTREMRHPDFSTSDEDDDEVLGSPLWETTPPAPGSNKESELKYIDLDHDDSLEQPMRSPVGANSSVQPTEYHEIDFVKTDALKNVRETTTKERQKQADS